MSHKNEEMMNKSEVMMHQENESALTFGLLSGDATVARSKERGLQGLVAGRGPS
jgi:hypothetical protein